MIDFASMAETKFRNREDLFAHFLPRGLVGAELGVMRANHSQRMLESCSPKKLYLVDPWPNRDRRWVNVVDRFAGDDRVVVLRMTAVMAKATAKELDFVEHDTASGWPQAYDELLAYDENLKDGGYLIYDCSDVRHNNGTRHMCLDKFLRLNNNYHIVAFTEEYSVAVAQKRSVSRSFDSREAMYAAFPRGVGSEVGVLLGRNAKNLLSIAKPERLYLIDSWSGPDVWYKKGVDALSGSTVVDGEYGNEAYRIVSRSFAGLPVEIIRGDSVSSISSLTDSSLDWAYIDADHSRGGCLADLNACLPKMKPNCVISGHDFVNKNLFGVISAVWSFLDTNKDFRMVGLADSNRFASYMLARGDANV